MANFGTQYWELLKTGLSVLLLLFIYLISETSKTDAMETFRLEIIRKCQLVHGLFREDNENLNILRFRR